MIVNTPAAEKFPQLLLCEILQLGSGPGFWNQNALNPLAWSTSEVSTDVASQ
jgi:hypothetical protein